VRLEAADALGNIPDPQAIRPLIDHANSDIQPRPCASPAAEALRNYARRTWWWRWSILLDNRDFSVAWQAPPEPGAIDRPGLPL